MDRRRWISLVLVVLAAASLSFGAYLRGHPHRAAGGSFPLLARISSRLQYLFRRPGPIGIWRRDERYGFSLIPNSRGRHRTPDFDVTYTIGPEGERYIPAPRNPLGRILFLGDSFTFGHGVGDDENYPYLLSRAWGRWEVLNKAVNAWTTSHAYLLLQDELKKPEAPTLVVYGMIPEDIPRNYIRKSWVEFLAGYGREHPHFELVDGTLVFQGVVGVDGSLEDSDDVERKEIDITCALLAGMDEMCGSRNVPLVVILFGGDYPEEVLATLSERRIPVLDLRTLKIVGFPGDGHPNPADHRRIADAILGSFIPKILEEAAAARS